MKRIWLALSLVFASLGMAQAQNYPNRPLRLFIPFAAGGAVDTIGRMIGQKLTEQMGQPVIIENRAGAGGNMAPDALAKSPPDGYSILLTTNGLAISPALYKTLPFDVHKDFIPVTQVVQSQLVLAASTKFEAKNAAEFIALAKAKPGGLNYGSTGVGNPLQLTMEMLKSRTGIEIMAVPYRGDAPLNAALIAGEIQVAVIPMAPAVPLVEGHQIKALAVFGAKRSPAMPNAPTIGETIPGFESGSWQGLFVPAGTPREIVVRLQQETAKALKSPDVLNLLRTGGNEPVGSTPDEFAARFKADIELFAKVVADAKIPKQD
ncbi:MAG: tripartite tricarboxylate transporter substrate binding protein [Pseudomonadota bacterium]